MHTRHIGSLEVSAVGLGCMNMSMGYGPADDAVSARLLATALDCGYCFIDTAAMYGNGHNETLIGRTLRHRRREYILASKGGFTKDETGDDALDGRPQALVRGCEDSLRRLRTDVIDLYYLHRLDPAVAIEESVGALADLVRAGKVREIGLSEVSTQTLRRAHAVHPIAAVQSEYSLWSRTPEHQLLAACTELGAVLVPFAPLARGFLTGCASDVSALSVDDIRCTNARPRFEPDAFAANETLLPPYRAIAERVGCSLAQLALAWILAQSDTAGRCTMTPIPGTKHIEYMRDNAGAGDLRLDAETIAELDALINESTVTGRRYTDAVMDAIDSERDRPQSRTKF